MSALGSVPVASLGAPFAPARPFFDALSPVPSAGADPSRIGFDQVAAQRTARLYNQLLDNLILYNGSGNPQSAVPAVGPTPILFYAPGSMANAAALLGGMIGPTPAVQLGAPPSEEPLIFESSAAATAAAITGPATLDIASGASAGADLGALLATAGAGNAAAATGASNPVAGPGGDLLKQLLQALLLDLLVKTLAAFKSYDATGKPVAAALPIGSLLDMIQTGLTPPAPTAGGHPPKIG